MKIRGKRTVANQLWFQVNDTFQTIYSDGNDSTRSKFMVKITYKLIGKMLWLPNHNIFTPNIVMLFVKTR